jgi:hypothetical protein
MEESSHFLYLVILFLHLDKKILIDKKIKFIARAKTSVHAINVHLGNQVSKQHLSIKLEGAVTFSQKPHLLMIRFSIVYLNEVFKLIIIY